MTVSPEPITYTSPEVTTPYPGCTVSLAAGHGPAVEPAPVFFFDIDNCLYPRSTKIHDMMQVMIHQYFKQTLQLDDEEAHRLHIEYYTQYGLALEGLVRHHKVDALAYNTQVDDALALKDVLEPNPALRAMLHRVNPRFRRWLLTNAYRNHALRCVLLVGIGDCFDGLTFCDYAKLPIVCKPMDPYFADAFAKANVGNLAECYFVDDSGLNCRAGLDLGIGTVIHYVEVDSEWEALQASDLFPRYYEAGGRAGGIKVIRDILELETTVPEVFQ